MRIKTKYLCQECGQQSARWLGRCPGCGTWNSLIEECVNPRKKANPSPMGIDLPRPITEVSVLEEERFSTELGEMDRVLGGGLVPGSLVLLGGDPGIGKSTLLLQVSQLLSRRMPVLYVSGEESIRQVRLRADRLGELSPDLLLLSETDIDIMERHLRELAPPVAVIDSIQTMYKGDLGSAPGSVGQVRECAAQLMRLAKTKGISIFLVGHVTKEGVIAGPRVLEHMVDTVLYLEGERRHFFRILRCVKNRFGSTNEIGIFEMGGSGLIEVTNPSALFLVQHSQGGVPGSAVAAALEGSRPLLVEIQALVSPSGYGTPRRMTAGVDYNRVALITAVLEKRVGLNLGSHDIYVNAVGGVKLDEPAVDLAIACALTSSFRDKPVDSEMALAGEIGLTGELRLVTGVEKRVKEAFKLGFKRFLLSGQSVAGHTAEMGILTADTLATALDLAIKV
ncbi:MAG: DNA repair protein RadA [Desulfotomaculaceae bacterium]|nr:DNA repair protein RadA [Desulfotomaculaceae bacterium]MDD4767527.1 DNA repair protein RadA [Desulfotomaculaceae bacterium]